MYTKLYLNRYNYNMALVVENMARLVVEKGGVLLSQWKDSESKPVIVHNGADKCFTYHTTWTASSLSFYLDGFVYIYSTDDNMLFSHKYLKTPVVAEGYLTKKEVYLNEICVHRELECYKELDDASLLAVAENILSALIEAEPCKSIGNATRRYYPLKKKTVSEKDKASILPLAHWIQAGIFLKCSACDADADKATPICPCCKAKMAKDVEML